MKKDKLGNFVVGLTLDLFRVGSDSINWKILNLLDCSTAEVGDKIELSSMPLNRRINELEDVGLLVRNRRQGLIKCTKLTPLFIDSVNALKSKVKVERMEV